MDTEKMRVALSYLKRKHPGCGKLVPYGTMYREEHKILCQHDRKTTKEKGYGSR